MEKPGDPGAPMRRRSATFLAGTNLLLEIASLTRKSSPRFMAVAYASKDASHLFPFKKGDVLIVDMSEEAVRSGNTDPREIEVLYRKGVRLYTRQFLHAKIFVFDHGAIVGSANLSKNSLGNEEAAVWISDPVVYEAIKRTIREWAKEPITPEYIKHCKRIYNPPKGRRRRGRQAAQPEHRLWVGEVDEGDPPKWMEHQISAAERKARKRIVNKKKYEPYTTWTYQRDRLFRDWKRNDWVVEILRPKKGPLEVWPPRRLLQVKSVNKPRGSDSPKYMYQLETPKKKPDTLPWAKFKQRVRSAGIDEIYREDWTLLRSRRTVDALQRVFQQTEFW